MPLREYCSRLHEYIDRNARIQGADIAAIMLGALVLMLPALINGFPFIFFDSVDYLVMFTRTLYRSPFYGLLMTFFHLKKFIWAIVIVQALITSHLVYLFIVLFSSNRSLRNFAITIAILTLFSSLPCSVGFIMPDIFTSIMLLAMYLIAFYFDTFGKLLKYYLLLLGSVATAVHLSNLSIAVAALAVLAGLILWRKDCRADADTVRK